MDSCCKMTDKVNILVKGVNISLKRCDAYNSLHLSFSSHQYLLAMAFVYFKRACFTIAEYTRKNLFVAL